MDNTFGCGTWSVILSEEHRLRMLENRVLRKTREAVGYVTTQLFCILFIILTTTCFDHCGPSSGQTLRERNSVTLLIEAASEGDRCTWCKSLKTKMGTAK